MRDDMQRANELLEFVTHALDELTEILERADNTAVRNSGKLVDESTQALLNVHQILHVYFPDLAPLPTDDPELNAQLHDYASLLIATQNLWSERRYAEAVDLWRAYVASEPFYYYDLMAKRMLAHIEKQAAEMNAPPNAD